MDIKLNKKLYSQMRFQTEKGFYFLGSVVSTTSDTDIDRNEAQT